MKQVELERVRREVCERAGRGSLLREKGNDRVSQARKLGDRGGVAKCWM